MQITSATAIADNTATKSSSKTNAATDTNDMFMKLLVAQLKSQDPTSPMDPTQFVGQLVQFNSLSELVKIRQLIDPSTQATSNNASSSATTAVAGGM